MRLCSFIGFHIFVANSENIMERLSKYLVAFCLSIIALSANAADDVRVKTYVENGKLVYYCTMDSITVVVNPNIRGLFEPVISIINENDEEVIFRPENIKAYTYEFPYIAETPERYQLGDFFLTGGDTSELEKKSLQIYPYKKYRKISARNMWWGNLVTGMANAAVEGAVAGLINTPQAHFYTSLHVSEFDAEKRYERQAKLKRIDQGYWQANTLFPDSESYGFISVKSVKSDHLLLDIPIGDNVFQFFIFQEASLTE